MFFCELAGSVHGFPVWFARVARVFAIASVPSISVSGSVFIFSAVMFTRGAAMVFASVPGFDRWISCPGLPFG